MVSQADLNSTILALAVGVLVPITLAIINRGAKRVEDKLDQLQTQGVQQLAKADKVHEDLADKLDHVDGRVDQVDGRVRHVEGEVETIRRHQLLDVLAARHRSVRSWRRLFNSEGKD